MCNFCIFPFLLLLLPSSAPLQVQNLTPQLVNAGTIKMTYPENKAADENFENLRKQYAAGVQTIRDFCDESIDIATFLRQTEEHIRRSVATCEEGVATKHSQVQTTTYNLHLELAPCTCTIYMNSRLHQVIVESTTLAARLSNRLLMALGRESENSEDVSLKKQVGDTHHSFRSYCCFCFSLSCSPAPSPSSFNR